MTQIEIQVNDETGAQEYVVRIKEVVTIQEIEWVDDESGYYPVNIGDPITIEVLPGYGEVLAGIFVTVADVDIHPEWREATPEEIAEYEAQLPDIYRGDKTGIIAKIRSAQNVYKGE